MVGAIAFFLAGIIYISFIIFNIFQTGFEWYYLAWALQISGLALFTSFLYFLAWKKT